MTSRQVLVVSMSEVALFNRCRKAYELGYVRNLEPIVTSDAVIQGSSFHAIMEKFARKRRGEEVDTSTFTDEDPMVAVAGAYLNNKGLIDFSNMAQIIAVEEPLYTRILPADSMVSILKSIGYSTIPAVYLRTTFDLVYKRQTGWIVLRDYKTFGVAPSFDYDLDFQARLYVSAGMQKHDTTEIEFEFENVRREVPNVKRGAKGQLAPWKASECYITQPLVIGEQEARAVWMEARHIVANILMARALGAKDPAVWYRQALKVGPHSCGTCFYRHLCKADYNNSLDADFIQEHAKPRKITVPPEGALA